MSKRTKWRPTRDELIEAFAQLAIGVGGMGIPRWQRALIVDLCYARRDLQLALLGYVSGPPQPLAIRNQTDECCVSNLDRERTARGLGILQRS